jgi:predicted nucleic acid-binding protein
LILVDTSIWVRALRSKRSSEAQELDRLIELDEVAITDMVAAEVLQGARTESDFQRLEDKLDALHFFHADEETWLRAARLSFDLKRRGLKTPLSDLVIAQVALDNDLTLFAVDAHFERVDTLSLHKVGS